MTTFFEDYLLARRAASRHTVCSYRDTLKLFFSFAARRRDRPVSELRIADLDVELVLAFLEYLEKERHNSVATRNARTGALHVFFNFLAELDPLALELSQRISAIPFKRAQTRSIDYLERSELEHLLSVINRGTVKGRRDYALVSFMYNTAVRVSEAVGVRSCDLQLTGPHEHVRLWAKGRKERILPLWPQTTRLLRDLLHERDVDLRSARPVFVNLHRGTALTRFGVRDLLRKYVKVASRDIPELAKKRIHPHSLRHTAAVHMLHAGVDLGRIAQQLGHASTTTTNRYAQASLEMKRQALQSCALPDRLEEGTASWTKDPDLLEWLKKL